MATKMANVHGAINVFEMAAGQMWRLVLDSWGIAGIGLVAAAAVVVRRGVRTDLRIMATLAVAVTVVTACTAPAALPPVRGFPSSLFPSRCASKDARGRLSRRRP